LLGSWGFWVRGWLFEEEGVRHFAGEFPGSSPTPLSLSSLVFVWPAGRIFSHRDRRRVRILGPGHARLIRIDSNRILSITRKLPT